MFLGSKAKLLCKQYGHNICPCYRRAVKGREKLRGFPASYKATEISKQTKFALNPSIENECLGSRIKKIFLTNAWINVLNVCVYTADDI